MKKQIPGLLLTVFVFLLLSGCFQKDSLKPPVPGNGERGSTPLVLTPVAEGLQTAENEHVSLDISHMDQGYVMLKWLEEPGHPVDGAHNASDKIKLRITGPAHITYTYNLSADRNWHVFPLTDGDGDYTLNVFENIEGTQYFEVFSHSLQVLLSDELLPFLYPNEYVDFDRDTKAVALAEELAADSDTDLDVIYSVFYYVVTNISYDTPKAETVRSDYLPNVDETLDLKKGICFDYASLMTAMLRSQGIPAKLDIGYVGTIYHAWISAWVEDKGWIYNIIEFDGTTWNMMDPTMASTESQGEDIKNYINNDKSYFVKYSY